MSNNFHIGQKVVCIHGGRWTEEYMGWTYPVHGKVYTIRSIESPPFFFGFVALLFEEIVNPNGHYPHGTFEPCFDARYFRPVKTTDISIFTAMLAPTPRVKQPV